jgi:hypothetical protein
MDWHLPILLDSKCLVSRILWRELMISSRAYAIGDRLGADKSQCRQEVSGWLGDNIRRGHLLTVGVPLFRFAGRLTLQIKWVASPTLQGKAVTLRRSSRQASYRTPNTCCQRMKGRSGQRELTSKPATSSNSLPRRAGSVHDGGVMERFIGHECLVIDHEGDWQRDRNTRPRRV